MNLERESNNNPLKQFLKHPYTFPVFLFILLINLLINNQCLSLWDQDEAAYAGFAYHFLESGNWLIPEFMWSEPHRKTPLHFWTIAICYKIFGVNEFAVRFPSVMAVFFTVFITYYQGRKFFGCSIATLGAMILGSSFFLPALGKVSVTDATLLFFETVCMFGILHVLVKQSWKWVIIFWISFSLAVLTKGPPVFIVTGIFALLILIFYPKRERIFRLHPWFFLPIALLPLLIWGYFAWQHDDGKFITWMIDWYILRRATDPVFGQTGPPGSYLIIFFATFLPFGMFIPSVIKNSFSKIKKEKYLFLGGWLIAGWLIYELLASKLPAYVLASYPAMALLLANEVIKLYKKEKIFNTALKIGISTQALILLILSAGLVTGALMILDSKGIIAAISSSLFLLGLQISGYYYMIRKKNYFYMTLSFIASGVIFFFMIWQFLIPSFEKERGASKRVAEYVKNNATADADIIFSKNYNMPTFAFYLKKQFDTLKVNSDLKYLEKNYQSEEPKIFIIHKDWQNKLKKQHPNWKLKSIKGWVSDRFKGSEYFVLINKAALK